MDTAYLREHGKEASGLLCGQLCVEAADEIERLRAALKEILNDVDPAAHNGATGAISVRAIARRALEQKGPE